MSIGAKCRAPLNKNTNVIECKRCVVKFHIKCVNISAEDFMCLRDLVRVWYSTGITTAMKGSGSPR